jgi:four helix bundle protein
VHFGRAVPVEGSKPRKYRRADFIHKLRIVLKELNETKSWLEQIVANGLFSRDKMSATYRAASKRPPAVQPVQFEISDLRI